VVLPIARAAPLVLAGLAFAMLAIATVVLVISLAPPRRPTDPEPAEAPPVAALDVEDVERYITEQEQAKESTEKASRPAREGLAAPESSAAAVVLANEIHRTRAALEEKGIAWETQYRTECVERIFGTCIDTRRRVVTHGLGDRILMVLSLHDVGDMEETVRLEAEGATYVVNPSNAETKAALLEELRTVISAESTREPRERAIAWLELRERHDRERIERIDEEAERVAAEAAAARTRYEEALANRRARLTAALAGLGIGLGSLIVLGLGLAVLSIERNTRVLRHRDPAGALVP
jgi:hypothetical protein